MSVQEARFDRHFVRDLTWSRHQLEELAERRFVAAQRANGSRLLVHAQDAAWSGDASDAAHITFNDLFKQVGCSLGRSISQSVRPVLAT